MDHSWQVEVLERLLRNVDAGTCDSAPATSRGAQHDLYSNPERLEQEKAILFRRYPIVVGMLDEVKAPGDYITHNETGVPILVVRTAKGVLNAFVNICRHRCAALKTEACGHNMRAIVCQYHGWVYDTSGNLVSMPEDWGFPDIEKSTHGLVRLPVAERHGFIWVQPTPSSDLELDVDAFLGPLGPELAGLDLGSLHTYNPDESDHRQSTVIRRELDWKIMVDTFMEFYHFPYAHRRSVSSPFQKHNPAYDFYGTHYRVAIPKRTITELRDKPKSEWRLLDHSILIYLLFPNTILTVMPDHIVLFSVFPTTLGNGVTRVGVYVNRLPENEKGENYWKKNSGLAFAALKEDFDLGASIQRNSATGLQDTANYGRFEHGLDVYHRALDQALRHPGILGADALPPLTMIAAE